ncbi:MAG: hypothetical protein HZC28_02825 [Spirochaetes bacterium]|nr:hypothetical protein [Spirochaetota bacterium]
MTNKRMIPVTAVLGVGDETIPHDRAGIIVARELAALVKAEAIGGIHVFECGVTPEHFSGVLRPLKPARVVIVDAMSPGVGEDNGVRVVSKDQIGGISFSTHALPLTVFLRYLESSLGCTTAIIGITGDGDDETMRGYAARVLELIVQGNEL